MKVKYVLIIILVVIGIVLLPKKEINQQPIEPLNTDSLEHIIDSLSNLEAKVDTFYKNKLVYVEKEQASIKNMPVDSLIKYIMSHYDSVTIYKKAIDTSYIVTDSLSLTKWGSTITEGKICSIQLENSNRLIELKDERIASLNELFSALDSTNNSLALKYSSLSDEHTECVNKIDRRNKIIIGLGAAIVLVLAVN